MRHKNSIKKKGGATPKSASAKQEASEDSSPGHHLRSLSVKELNPIGFPSKVSPITPHDTKFMMPSDLSSSQNQLNHHQPSLSHSQSSPFLIVFDVYPCLDFLDLFLWKFYIYSSVGSYSLASTILKIFNK